MVPVEVEPEISGDEKGTIISKIKAFANSSNSSNLMEQILAALMTSRNSLTINQAALGRANLFGIPVQNWVVMN